jgi:hypothetical protein
MEKIAKERSDVGFFLIPVSVYGASDKGGPKSGEVSSVLAAQAVIAAAWQDPMKAVAFWAKMPPMNKEASKTVILGIAKEVGLDSEKLERDLSSDSANAALISNGLLAENLGLPIQLPVVFLRQLDGTLSLIPPFVKDKMIIVLDAVNDGKPWAPAIAASVNPESKKRVPSGEEANKSEKPEKPEDSKAEKAASNSDVAKDAGAAGKASEAQEPASPVKGK